MYTLRIGNEIIYSPTIDELAIENPSVSLELNKTGTIEFQLPLTHPYYEKIQKLQTDISLYEDEKLLWKFRVLNDELDFCNFKNIIGEGDLSYLLDSIQRPYQHKGSIKEFFTQLILTHNSQVEARKQFKVGVVDVIDENNNTNRSDGHMSKTLDVINDKLLKTHGGYLRTRHESAGTYVDYIADYNSINPQVIRFGENLLDITRYIKGEHIRTAIIPQGAETDVNGINDVKKRVDITSKNGGKDYVFDQTAVNLFGWIWETIELDDVIAPEKLKQKAETYLKECINFQMAIELSAFDLHLLDADIKSIRIGDWIRVVSKPHELDRLFLVSKIDINISNPEQSKIYLGGTIETFTANTTKDKKELSESVKKTASSAISAINDKVKNATDLINGVNGGYIYTKYGVTGKPEELFIMDKPTPDTANNLLRLNKNGLGFSTSGINGDYSNAWTIDGNLVADYITSGSMLADRIQGGSLLLGYITSKVSGSLSVVDKTGFTMLSANKNGVGIGGDYLHYFADGRDMPFGVGGFNIVERSSSKYGAYYYWESAISRKNGIASGGPWIVWGGWDTSQNPDYPEAYKFVVFDDGRCKAMSWITGSLERDKKNIVKFDKSGLDIVRQSDVHEYDLRASGEHRIGFVIGDNYKLSEQITDDRGTGVELYSALAVAYKAIQELEERIKELESRCKDG